MNNTDQNWTETKPMTKQIRIENADNSNHKVTVQVWEVDHSQGVPDKLITEHNLDYACQLITETIWANRYLIVKEKYTKAKEGMNGHQS